MTGVALMETRAVLFDRDGTLVTDVPYNTDPQLVESMPTAVAAIRLLRRHRMRLGIVSNQSGVARGLISPRQLAVVNDRVEEILGPFDVWCICPHGVDDGCPCRKPRPGLVLDAARRLGLKPAQLVVIGDIGTDIEAATAAGAPSILVPTPRTRFGEILDAPVVAPDLLGAAAAVLEGRLRPPTVWSEP